MKYDRLLFKKTILPNGFTIYSQLNEDVELVESSLVVPFGHAHNHGVIIPGTAHYLEHVLMKRSQLYPEIGSCKAKAFLYGGNFGATTSLEKTAYSLALPTSVFSEMLDGVISHFFYPIFKQDEIVKERGIIASERKKEGPFFPGKNSTEHYLRTQWKDHRYSTAEQIFGTDEDFLDITSDYFYDIHKMYSTTSSYFVVAGNFDLDEICRKFEAIPLQKSALSLESVFCPIVWKNKEFHIFESQDISRTEYNLQWIYSVNPDEERVHSMITKVIGTMLFDYSLGTVMDWLRHKNGQIYEIDRTFSIFKGVVNGGCKIPLHSIQQAHEVKEKIQSLMYETLGNKDILEKVKMQKRNSMLFLYQRPIDRITEVLYDLHWHSTIVTETDQLQYLEQITSAGLQELFIKQIQPNIGELLVVPK